MFSDNSSIHESSTVRFCEKHEISSLQLKNLKHITGYKHKLTGQIFHNRAVQTEPSPCQYSFVLKFHRDAQTLFCKDQAQQTPRDACTQVQGPNIFINSSGDKIMTYANKYVYADEIKKNILNKVIIIQRYTRCWLAKQELLRRRKILLLKQLWNKKQEKINALESPECWLKELERRRLNPQTEEDFKLLFSDLQKWWTKESQCLSEAISGADLKAAKWLLVNSESKQIEEINRKRLMVEHQTLYAKRNKSLKMAAKPKVWKAYKNTIKVDTGNTLEARSLYDLYVTLSMKHTSPQDRISALKSLKEVLQPYSGKLTKNLMQLADREIDLQIRGIKPKLLEGLQARIRDLFWHYAKSPLINPEMERKVKKESGTPYILSCASCKNFYVLSENSTDEALGQSVLENYFRKCKKCLNIENEAWIRKDLELHKRILHLLITEEEKRESSSGLICVLQPSDIGHIVDNIWKRQSCLSGSKNDEELKLTRFTVEKNWTPWNCILVTRQEAETLSQVTNLETAYDQKFRERVSQRHAEARRYFSMIPRFWPYLYH